MRCCSAATDGSTALAAAGASRCPLEVPLARLDGWSSYEGLLVPRTMSVDAALVVCRWGDADSATPSVAAAGARAWRRPRQLRDASRRHACSRAAFRRLAAPATRARTRRAHAARASLAAAAAAESSVASSATTAPRPTTHMTASSCRLRPSTSYDRGAPKSARSLGSRSSETRPPSLRLVRLSGSISAAREPRSADRRVRKRLTVRRTRPSPRL